MLFIVPKIQSQTNDILASKANFEKRMDRYIEAFCADEANRVFAERALSHGCAGHDHPVSEAVIDHGLRQCARDQFVSDNLEEFSRYTESNSAVSSATSVSICDNGGFENGFTHYTGSTATVHRGSNTCTPTNIFGVPVSFSSQTLPVTDRIVIVSSGTDTLVGIQKTRFGSKALRLNHRYGHSTQCDGNRGADRIEKEFEVTEENRQFTVWYALVLENPASHTNTQPWFSITCDLAPDSDLCLDADILSCEETYTDSASVCTFDSIDVLDWTCHRIVIPKSEIGNIATLEITMGDCGQLAHFGYAYIDGICEECTGSTDGVVKITNIDTCHFDSTICGEYGLPAICDLTWSLVDITAPGYTIDSLTIDSVNGTFCFDFPRSNIAEDSCQDVAVKARFSNTIGDTIEKYSNTLIVCDTFFNVYYKDLSISACDNNVPFGGTDDGNLSDDYYFVEITIQNTNSQLWAITQQLDDPYPKESGYRELASGTSAEVLELGPFRIQEGPWEMTIIVNGCVFTEQITPPNYCSGCSEFHDMVIDNIECNEMNDTWSFNIFVSGSGTYTLTTPAGNQTLDKGETENISGLAISDDCVFIELEDNIQQNCEASFYICPPIPCDVECDLDVYIEEITCEDDNGVTYSVDLDASGSAGLVCYEAKSLSGTTLSSGSVTGSQIIGSFTQDIYLVIYECTMLSCAACVNPTCYKVLYIPTPEPDLCEETGSLIASNEKDEAVADFEALRIYPNPIDEFELNIETNLEIRKLYIYNQNGQIVDQYDVGTGSTTIEINGDSGLYILKFVDTNGNMLFRRILKL